MWLHAWVSQVEEVLLTHEAVSEVAVVGVPHLEGGEEEHL